MRILQIVAVVSPDNVYGGPTTVAVNQCRVLADAGHEVTLAAVGLGFESAFPSSWEGVPVRLFPGRRVLPGAGFAGLASPALHRWLTRHVHSFDVVHVHLARDLVTLPAARIAQRAGVPVHAMTHGMIDASDNPLAAPLDAAMTARVLRDCVRVFHLTPREHDDLRSLFGDGLRLAELHNGVLVPGSPPERDPDRDPTVLYLARVQERKRPGTFVEAARRLAAEFSTARFVMIGPDEGIGEQVRAQIAAAGLGDRLVWHGPATHAEGIRAMAEADVYVLPSVDEPYPMSVLEAMSQGLPVVVTDSCGLAPAVAEHGAGIVTDASVEQVTDAVRTLLADPAERRATGERAYATASEVFGMPAIAQRLVEAYSLTAPAAGRSGSSAGTGRRPDPRRVLFVGINYAPESTGIAPYTAGMAERLASAGHRVRVITGVPHYPSWSNFTGMRGLRRRERVNGIGVQRIRHYIGSGGHGLGRVWQEISFGAGAVTSSWRGAQAVVAVSPALLATACVVARARLSGRPVGVWVQDLYSSGAAEIEKAGLVSRLLTRVESWVLGHADGVLVIHTRFRDHVVSVLGVDPAKVTVCRNWSHVDAGRHDEELAAGLRRQYFGDAPLVAMHTGNMGAKQGLENLVDVARHAERTGSDTLIALVGDGSRREALMAYGAGVRNLVFVPSLPDEEYRAILSAGDVLVVNEKPGLREMAVPSKLTTYFRSGKPVVAATESDSSTAAEMTAAGAGTVVPPADPAALLDAIERTAADPAGCQEAGRSARRFVQENLTADAAVATVRGWLSRMTSH
ncbi:glycosyltransferase [Propionibacterium australiense]|uniref:Glycosyltransferase n=1 Tax=Propionibacterium australiense TaxID=119981 RepID=A0A383S657_9ACTN|nr:glycosyltransferase [Propionibacterium australiense]RLP10654.1 glycosyltransferase [Propionibacterium australiense]RLP12949.1 glycosyltransferase [Propionibacterium australiense]SYZ32859.1 Glycosyltransferase subfamily 4-like, N-terminal domain [Propionibacterium australiense]VEH91101.1 Glycogen synthase [Propionibacterium australiense]